MVLQTVFNPNMQSAYCGQWYDLSDTDAVSRSMERSAAPFGVACVMGTNDNQCMLPDHGGYMAAAVDPAMAATVATVNKFVGISIYHAALSRQALALPIGDGDVGYIEMTDTVSLATHGRVFVLSETDHKIGDPVFFRHTLTANGAIPQTEQLGALRSDDDGGNAIQIAGAEFMHSSQAGELTILKLTGATQA